MNDVWETTGPIDEEWVESTCRFPQGEATCAFLVFGDGFHCCKGTPNEEIIRNRLVMGTMVAKGDHCEGWYLQLAKTEGKA